MAKSSAFRSLFTLRELGYVEQSPDSAHQLSGRVRTLARGGEHAKQGVWFARVSLEA